ncbi:Chromate resistance protein ChrB [Kineococcus gypseus]|uniref:Chromate resistance protein ChrB n=1 Tax=Kineococcus gypseus TaxID=1637102 RepID=UPI003D7D4D43
MPEGERSAGSTGEWVLLSYRLPREPSTPRIALWRKLKRCGVAQLGDGLVALPADARTREQLEWIAEEVVEAAGTAGVWLARPAGAAQERALAQQMADARAEEYAALAADAREALGAPGAERVRALRRLRTRWRETTRRDFFPPPQREAAAAALRELGDAVQDGAAQDGAVQDGAVQDGAVQGVGA